MTYAPKIVLHSPISDRSALSAFIEDCLKDGVCLIAVTGEGCAEVEELIDKMIVGDGSDESRFITTTSHPGESLGDVLTMVRWWSQADGEGQEIRL